jgi:hypothetical protein
MKCPAKTYQPEAGSANCLPCWSSKNPAQTECFDASATFSHVSLIAFVVILFLGIAACFYQMCATFDAKFCVDSLTGLPTTTSSSDTSPAASSVASKLSTGNVVGIVKAQPAKQVEMKKKAPAAKKAGKTPWSKPVDI